MSSPTLGQLSYISNRIKVLKSDKDFKDEVNRLFPNEFADVQLGMTMVKTDITSSNLEKKLRRLEYYKVFDIIGLLKDDATTSEGLKELSNQLKFNQ